MSNVFRSIGRIVTIFALCCAIGLHWLTLQSIAWTSMIIDYSKRGTLCQAIAQTFDGAHPCSLCRVVNKANSTENEIRSPSSDAENRHDLSGTRNHASPAVRSFRLRDYKFLRLRNQAVSGGSSAALPHRLVRARWIAPCACTDRSLARITQPETAAEQSRLFRLSED